MAGPVFRGLRTSRERSARPWPYPLPSGRGRWVMRERSFVGGPGGTNERWDVTQPISSFWREAATRPSLTSDKS